MEVEINTRGMRRVASRLAKHQPKVFDRATSVSLLWAVSKIASESALQGGRVARFEGNYQAGFRHTRVLGNKKNRYAKAYNIHGYSMVIEHGVKIWKRMPPPSAFFWWAQGKLGLGEKEARSFSFAMAKALMGKGNSKTARNARQGKARKALKVMTKVTNKLVPKIRRQFKKNYDHAVSVLSKYGMKI